MHLMPTDLGTLATDCKAWNAWVVNAVSIPPDSDVSNYDDDHTTAKHFCS